MFSGRQGGRAQKEAVRRRVYTEYIETIPYPRASFFSLKFSLL